MWRDWGWYWHDWTCERFLFACTGVWTGDLWMSSPALYHCTMETSGFHLWQFEVLNFGAEGLVVVLFWLDLWDIFFAHTRVLTGDLLISSHALYHCAMVTSGFHLWQFEVLNSGAEGLVVALCLFYLWENSFLPTSGFELGTWTLPLHQGDLWFSPLTIWGILLWCRGIDAGIVLIGPVRDFLFSHTGVWSGDLWISSPTLYHCTMATSGYNLW